MYATLYDANIILLYYMDIMFMVWPVGGSTADKCNTPKEEICLPNENMCDFHSISHVWQSRDTH